MKDDPPTDLWPLKFWESEDWFNVRVKLDFLEDYNIAYNPRRNDLFRALRLCSRADATVIIVGQDPYSNPDDATGVAFSSSKYGNPDTEGAVVRRSIPPSLRTLYREYVRDLQHPWPSSGCLEPWCFKGVLLWNATPTIEVKEEGRHWETFTHQYWPEWQILTREIIQTSSDAGERVFVFFGQRAQEYQRFVSIDNGVNTILCYSHPSPLARHNTIEGSGLFTTINDALLKHGRQPIDWRLP